MVMLLPLLGGAIAGGGAAAAGIGATTAAGIGLMGAASLASGMSNYQTGQFNAKVANQAAETTLRANELNEDRRLEQFRSLQGYQRAATGAAGFSMEGSPLQVMIDSARQYELDRGIRKYNTDVQSQQYRSQAKISRYQGNMGLIGSLLQTGGQSFRYANAE